MRGPEVSIGANEAKWHKITVAPVKEVRGKIPSDTAKHEAIHAVVGERVGAGVVGATIVPKGNSLGSTELAQPSAVAAAAPHAMGYGGTWHDISIVRWLGRSLSAVSSAARDIVSKNGEEIQAVASLIEEKGTVSGHEIREEMRNIGEGRGLVKVICESPDGEKHTEVVKAQGENVVFDSTWVRIEAVSSQIKNLAGGASFTPNKFLNSFPRLF